jgi:hypothetical protein
MKNGETNVNNFQFTMIHSFLFLKEYSKTWFLIVTVLLKQILTREMN